jgi:hypothetical protein
MKSLSQKAGFVNKKGGKTISLSSDFKYFLVEPLTATLGHPVFSDLYTAEGDPALSPVALRHPHRHVFR